MAQHAHEGTSIAVEVMEIPVITDKHRTAFQSLFRVARLLHGWTQAEVARRSGISQPVVHEIELGPRDGTSMMRVLKVAYVLGIEPNDIAASLGLFNGDGVHEEPGTPTEPPIEPVVLEMATHLSKLSESRRRSVMAIINYYRKREEQ